MVKKLELLAIAFLASIMCHAVYGWDIKLAKVDLKWFWEYQDSVATHGYKYCLEKIGAIKWKYSCENMILTFNGENGWWNKDLQSNCYKVPGDSCASKWPASAREQSFGFCQIHVRGDDYKSNIVFWKDYKDVTLADMKNKNFAPNFKDPIKQIETCVDMRAYASQKWSMPRYAYAGRMSWAKKVRFINPPLSDNIASPKFEVKTKITKRCTQISTIEENHYIQFDNSFWKFLYWIRNLGKGTKVFDCVDL